MESQQNHPVAEKRSRWLEWPIATALILLFLALLAAFVFYRLETWPGRTFGQSVTELERLGRKARDTFVELARLQPRVTVNNRVYLEQTTTVAELAVLARRVEVEHEMLQAGNITFDVGTAYENGVKSFVTFTGGDGTIITAFEVSFDEESDACVKEAVTVISTLKSVPVSQATPAP
jgi:hypothetical protein